MKTQTAQGVPMCSGTAACLAALMVPVLVGLPPCAAQTSAPTIAAAPAGDPAVTASRQAFEALPEADRKAIQEALIWVAPYNATAGGTFGRQTYNGIVAFQKMTGTVPDGILTARHSAALRAAANTARNAAGFKVMRDDKTGADIGVPQKVLPKQSVTPTGRRWQSPDGKITLDTRMAAGGSAEMQALYDKSIAAVPGRKVTYKFQRPDFFVVTGETASGEFYIRYALGPEGLRGFTFAYDKSVKASATRLTIAIANSFVPFPDDTSAPVPAPAAPAARHAAPVVSPVRAVADAAKVATGIRVGPRQVVTVGLACSAPVVVGSSAKIVKQAGNLALLEMVTEKAVVALPLRSGPVTAGSGLVTVGWDASARAVAVASASGEDGEGLKVALQAGGRGGLVFDRYGAVVGMVGSAKTPLRMLSGVAMPSSYAIVDIKTVQDFIGNSGSFVGEAAETVSQTAGAIASAAAARIIDVVCP